MGPFSLGRGVGNAVALKYIPPPTSLYRLKRDLCLPPGVEFRTIGGDVQQGGILISSCKRCGQCCRPGGPVLYRDGLSLLNRLDTPAKGTVPFGVADLVILRTGELACDDVIDTLTPLENECMRLTPVRGRTDWGCRLLVRIPDTVSDRDAGCGVYDRRPAQCRVLSCSDTRGIAELYGHDRASHAGIMRAVGVPEEWLSLFPAYEETCAYSRITPPAKLVMSPTNPGTPAEKEAAEALLETVRYSIPFHQLCIERGNIPEGCLLFLLGCPLPEVLIMFGLVLIRNDDRTGLIRWGEGRYGGPVFPDGKDFYRQSHH